ncbi:MAG: response regulator [Bryobacteraceae bacterium]|nr:response regulator [Bryobacteraceae bacterium]
MGWSSPQLLGFPTRRRPRSVARKYSLFTGILLAYVVFIYLGYDYWSDHFNPAKATAFCAAVVLIAGAVAKFTNRVLTQPLANLQEGITAVGDGRLDPIRVSRTADEFEFLGDSFNSMIEALAKSRDQIRQQHDSLEERIQERTAELEEASRKALLASKAKSEFLANMSHELRTPLTGVLGMIDVVLDSRLDADQAGQLRTARECALALLGLLNDILDLSKIEAGRMELEEIPVDLRAIVRECIEAVKPKAENKGLRMQTTVAPGLPARIAGDPMRLRQILTNLVSNAVKFTNEGFVEVRLRVDRQESGMSLTAEVLDTGTGIPADKLQSIFDEFTQADGSISRRYGGTGLGLAITRRLVKMHGGEISVSSEVGRGSTFRVTMPVKPIAEPPAPVTTPDAEERADGRETILVVEDNPVNQKVVTAILKKHGYGVVCANHGGEVIDRLEQNRVGLVLMDIQMPGVDGLEATRLIRAHHRWKNLPVVAITAHAMNGDRDMFLRNGMDGYLSKPINRPQLMAEVERCLLLSDHRQSETTVH